MLPHNSHLPRPAALHPVPARQQSPTADWEELPSPSEAEAGNITARLAALDELRRRLGLLSVYTEDSRVRLSALQAVKCELAAELSQQPTHRLHRRPQPLPSFSDTSEPQRRRKTFAERMALSLPPYHVGCRCPVALPRRGRSPLCNIEDNFLLCRILGAAQWDCAAAETRLRAIMAWRKANGIDHMLRRDDVLEDFWQSHWPVAFYHEDKMARPLIIMRTGGLSSALVQGKLEPLDVEYRYARIMELAQLHVLAQRHLWSNAISQIVLLIEMAGTNKRGLRLLRNALAMNQDYYPGLVSAIFLVNKPPGTRCAWMCCVKHDMISEETMERVHVIHNLHKPSALLEYIDAHSLPAEFGGVCANTVPRVLPWNGGWHPPPVEERRYIPLLDSAAMEREYGYVRDMEQRGSEMPLNRPSVHRRFAAEQSQIEGSLSDVGSSCAPELAGTDSAGMTMALRQADIISLPGESSRRRTPRRHMNPNIMAVDIPRVPLSSHADTASRREWQATIDGIHHAANNVLAEQDRLPNLKVV